MSMYVERQRYTPPTPIPTGTTTTRRSGTRTFTGISSEAERGARTSAYSDIDPRTFGMVSDEDMAAFRSQFERSMFGQSDAAVDAMIGEAGGAAQGGAGAALRAQMRSQAALPLAEIDYRRRERGASAYARLSQEQALEAYRALTRGGTEKYEEEGTTSGTIPWPPIPPGGGAGPTPWWEKAEYNPKPWWEA